MLSALRKTLRIKAAVAVAMLYGLCIVTPSLAFALADPDAAAHCLTEDHGFAAAPHHGANVHIHADGVAHHHSDSGGPHKQANDESKGHAANCCGLFSVVAIPGEPGFALGLVSPASLAFPVLHDAASGRGPERINRPPIA